jgi:SanA protein
VNWWILRSGQPRIFAKIEDTPAHEVALVLGTSRLAADGHSMNPFFAGRMDAAAALYHAGKVKHLLLSGDNGREGYDEPTWMRDALIQRQVPLEAITLDYAGFRTLDSVARAKVVFGLRQCLIVTDDFHIARSLFLAKAHDLDAQGFASGPVPWERSKKTRIREIASRAMAWLDIYLFRTKPKFYGPHVEIRFSAKPPVDS